MEALHRNWSESRSIPGIRAGMLNPSPGRGVVIGVVKGLLGGYYFGRGLLGVW